MSEDELEDHIVDAHDLAELMSYIRTYSDRIYVRAQNQEGRWASMALSELTAKQAIDFSFLCITRWFEAPGYRPVRLRTEDEMAAEPKKDE